MCWNYRKIFSLKIFTSGRPQRSKTFNILEKPFYRKVCSTYCMINELSKLSNKWNSVNHIGILTTWPVAVVWCCHTYCRQSGKCIAMIELHSQEYHAVIIYVLNIHFLIFRVNKFQMTWCIWKHFTSENFFEIRYCLQYSLYLHVLEKKVSLKLHFT